MTAVRPLPPPTVHDRLRHLLVIGSSDAEIRAALGMSQATVDKWRMTMPRPVTVEDRRFFRSLRKARERYPRGAP